MSGATGGKFYRLPPEKENTGKWEIHSKENFKG